MHICLHLDDVIKHLMPIQEPFYNLFVLETRL